MAFTNIALITIPAASVPGTGTDFNFPFLFKGTFAGAGGQPDLRHTGSGGDVTSTSGYDIAFSSDGLTANLDFHLRKYVSSTGEVIFWVNLPAINYGTDNTFYVLYGDSGITTDQSNASGAYFSANGKILLDQAAGVAVDAKGVYSFNTTGTPTPASTGKIHQAVDFNGSTDGYWDANSRLSSQPTQESFSAWLWADTVSAAPNGTFLQWANNNYNIMFYRMYDNAGTATMRERDLWSGTSSTHDVTGAAIATGQWIHVFATALKDNNSKLYVNGSLVSTQAISGNSISGANTQTGIGCYSIAGGQSQFFDGRVENVSFYLAEISADWIAAEYANQNNPSAFFSVAETVPPYAPTYKNFGTTAITNTHTTAGGSFEGWTKTTTENMRIHSYNAYFGTVFNSDQTRFGIRYNGGIDTAIEATPIVTDDANPGWITYLSNSNPAIDGGTRVLPYYGQNNVDGDGFNTLYYDGNVAAGNSGRSGFIENVGIGSDVDRLEFDSNNRNYSMYLEYRPLFVNHYYFRKTLTVNSSQVVSDEVNFPVLVSLTDADLAAKVESTSGFDIRFEDLNGNKLDHEIETWNKATGTLVAWVRLPNVYAATDVDFYIYYGNPDVTSTEENPTGVWDSSYEGVWHLNTDPTGSILDSTSNNNDLTSSGGMVAGDLIDGKIGKALDFEAASSQYLSIADASQTGLDFGGDFSISIWANFDAQPATRRTMVSKTNNVGDNSYLFPVQGDNRLAGSFYSDGTNFSRATSGTPFIAPGDVGNWLHIVFNVDVSAGNAGITAYKNGVSTTMTGVENNATSLFDSTAPFYIAADAVAGAVAGFFDGSICEVKVSSALRSTGWIQTEYANQNAPGTFLTAGTESKPDDVVFTNYSYQRKITINQLQVDENLTDFPNWFDFTANELKSVNNGGNVAYDDGRDIIFSSTNNLDGSGILPFEIAEYDPVNGRIRGFLKASVSSSTDTELYILYGNYSIMASQQDPLATWTRYSNYTQFHMWDTSPNTDYGSIDNTKGWSARGGTGGTNLEPQPFATGKMYRALDFQDTDAITLTEFDYNFKTPATFMGWVNLDVLSIDALYAKGQHPGDSTGYWHDIATDFSGKINVRTAESSTVRLQSIGSLSVGVWHHVAVTLTNTGVYSIYIDGSLDNTVGGQPTTWGNTLSGKRPAFGNRGNDNSGLNGKMEHWMVYAGALSATEISTIYNNQNAPGTYWTLGPQLDPGDFPNGFSHRLNATVPQDQVVGDSDHLNFPVLYSTTNDVFKTTANGGEVTNVNGYDIIFTDTLDNLLDFEIEKWDGTTGEIVAWIRIPTLFDLADTNFYVYVGDSGTTTDQSNPTGVWSSIFAAVWHMPEATLPLDSTSNNNDVVTDHGGTTATTTLIDGGQDFAAGGLETNDSASLSITGAITLSLWFRPDGGFVSGGGNEGLFYKNGLQHFSGFGTRVYDIALLGSTGSVIFSTGDGTLPGINVIQSTKTSWTDDWWLVHATFDGTTNPNSLEIYVNGQLNNQATATSNTIQNLAEGIMFGGRGKPGGLSYSFDGKMDEVRILNTDLQPGWIETEYNNQSDPAAFVLNSPILTPTLAAYSYIGRLTVDNTKVEGTSHTDFPVLWKGTYSWLKDTGNGGLLTSASGYDLIFSDGAGNILDHEIEHYDNTTGELVMWIKCPTLSGTVDTNIYYHYTNAAVTTSQENVAGTWAKFERVWHMDESSGTTLVDATGVGDATKLSATEPNPDANGQIYRSQDFLPPDDRATSSTLTGLDVAQGTISGWVYINDDTAPSANQLMWMIGNSSTTTRNEVFININYSGGGAGYGIQTAAELAGRQWTLSSLQNFLVPYDGTWMHIVLTHNGTEPDLLVNGVEITTQWQHDVDRTVWMTDVINAAAPADEVCIGNFNGLPGTSQYILAYNDKIEHIKVSDFSDLNWYKTEYNMESDNAAFLSVTDPNEPTGGGWHIFGDEGLVS